jgi:hypothetical protein
MSFEECLDYLLPISHTAIQLVLSEEAQENPVSEEVA